MAEIFAWLAYFCTNSSAENSPWNRVGPADSVNEKGLQDLPEFWSVMAGSLFFCFFHLKKPGHVPTQRPINQRVRLKENTQQWLKGQNHGMLLDGWFSRGLWSDWAVCVCVIMGQAIQRQHLPLGDVLDRMLEKGKRWCLSQGSYQPNERAQQTEGFESKAIPSRWLMHTTQTIHCSLSGS